MPVLRAQLAVSVLLFEGGKGEKDRLYPPESSTEKVAVDNIAIKISLHWPDFF